MYKIFWPKNSITRTLTPFLLIFLTLTTKYNPKQPRVLGQLVTVELRPNGISAILRKVELKENYTK